MISTIALHQALSTIPVNLAEFSIGLGNGWVAPMVSQGDPENADLVFTDEEASWIASLHYVSRGLSIFVTLFTTDRYGRVFTVVVETILLFVVWVGVLGSRNVTVHYIIRLIYGLAVGIHEVAAGIYLGENCSSHWRGTFNGVLVAFFYAGQVVAFVMVAHLPYNLVSTVFIMLSVLTILSTFLLKETPQFLIMKGNVTKAETNFNWLRSGDNPMLKSEFDDIKKNVAEELCRNSFVQLFCCREVYRSIRIVNLITFLAMMTGFSAISSFITKALYTSDYVSPSLLTTVFGVIQCSSTCIASSVMDKFNRRSLMLATTAIISIIHCVTAALYIVNSHYYAVPRFKLFLFVTLTTYASLFGMFMFPLMGVLRGELLPQSIKSFGSGSALMAGSLGGFLAARIFLPISKAYGEAMNFVLFSVVGLILFLYAYFDLPETNGKTLVEIQRELKGEQVRNETQTYRDVPAKQNIFYL